MAISITQENYETEIKQSNKPIILDIYATWCGPCQQMTPIFEELEKEFGDRYKFAKLNVDEARDISIKEYGVTSVPTFVFIKDGIIKGKETGYMSKDTISEKITAAFAR
ncbi:MAG TPA: thioredoxin [Candidatus Babeliales bacterium]|nr:thioredoxin [Candidatus Babeliales bacterium]